jgi:diguanylate cyclase (GGDEF)-like protein
MRREKRAKNMRDDLTGLPSRKAFFSKLLSIEEGTSVTVLLIDIDNFRFVNFTYGYRIGDLILKSASSYFKKILGYHFKNVYVARTGANQFGVLIFNDVPVVRIEEVFKRYLHFVEFRLNADSVGITNSVGVSSGNVNYERVFLEAEEALFEAKNLKNTLVTHENFKFKDFEKFKRTREKLIKAIRDSGIVPYFQPIVSLRTGEIFGYEVLSRIFVDGELLRGDYVFAVADSLALTPDIDKQLFLKAINFFSDYKLFFNLSMKYFFIELNNIFQITKQHSLDLSNVIFEITESQRIVQEGTAVTLFKMFKEFNAKVAVDDFGAGYSNFMYLKKFPADVLKIDGAFVRNSKNDIRDLTIVKSIVQVARAFKLRSLAEFIEDEETYRLMREVGVSLGQGYFIGKPEPEPKKIKIELN